MNTVITIIAHPAPLSTIVERQFDNKITYTIIHIQSYNTQRTESLSPRTADADTDGMCGLALTVLSAASGL